MKELSICVGSACHLKGSYNVIQTFQQMMEELGLHDKLELKATFCLKSCHEDGVSMVFDGKKLNVSSEGARKFFLDVVVPAL